MFWHGIDEIHINRDTGKILQIRCNCGMVFYPSDSSAFETFNRHLSDTFDGLREICDSAPVVPDQIALEI